MRSYVTKKQFKLIASIGWRKFLEMRRQFGKAAALTFCAIHSAVGDMGLAYEAAKTQSMHDQSGLLTEEFRGVRSSSDLERIGLELLIARIAGRALEL